jgi:hypothetical protein
VWQWADTGEYGQYCMLRCCFCSVGYVCQIAVFLTLRMLVCLVGFYASMVSLFTTMLDATVLLGSLCRYGGYV